MEDLNLAAAWERALSLAVRMLGQASPLVLTISRCEDASLPLLAEEETIETLRRCFHEEYRAHWGGRSDVTAVPWSRLPFDEREDNRSVADHVWTKARDLEVLIGPGTPGSSMLPGHADVEALAAAEHQRWIASRAIAGWREGTVLSEIERRHPSMRPWERLPEPTREKNRQLVRRIPMILAQAGLVMRPLRTVPFEHLPPEPIPARRGLDSDLRADPRDDAEPNIVLVVDSAESFRTAQRLVASRICTLVIAQPLSGLAVAAGLSAETADTVARAARAIWITAANAAGGDIRRMIEAPTCAG